MIFDKKLNIHTNKIGAQARDLSSYINFTKMLEKQIDVYQSVKLL